MTHELRPVERFRQIVASVLHVPVSLLGLYAERSTPRDQYALTVEMPYPLFEASLHRLGFVRNFVSSLKTREYAAPPEVSVGSWVYYPDGPRRSHYQVHLGLYVGPDERSTDVYAHWEPSWIRHPIRHYRAREVVSEEGVRRIRRVLEEHGTEFTVKSPEDRYKPVDSSRLTDDWTAA